MSSSGRDNVEGKSVNGAAAAASNEGESRHPQDESVKYIETIWKEMSRVLHHLPNLTLLSLLR